jgi:hypothetical protein
MLSAMPSEQMGPMMPDQPPQLGDKCCDVNTSLNESLPAGDSSKSGSSSSTSSPSRRSRSGHFKQHRHSHNIDHTLMGGFYEASMTKMQEVMPQWATNWQPKSGQEPMVIGQKQMVFEQMRKFVTGASEPVVLLPNFDFTDVLNFERFLQALKVDGINAIGKYKQYLNNKDMKKLDIDMCMVHAKYGIMLFEVRECDHLDAKRRGKAKSHLNSARSALENLVKLIVDAKGLPHDTIVPVTEFIVLPNMDEKPMAQPSGTTGTGSGSGRQPMTQKAALNATFRTVHYVCKQDLECNESLAEWWCEHVSGRVEQWPAVDTQVLNYFMAVLSGVRHNTLLPVVHQELKSCDMDVVKKATEETNGGCGEVDSPATPAMSYNICAEFFHEAHERVRGLSKCVLSSKDAEKVRRATCLQTLWLLLNDPSKKVSVVCSEKSKPVYEEYFARQRKLYSNLNNVRFYTNLKNCGIDEHNTVGKKDGGDLWFFDCHVDELTKDVIERIENLSAFWVFVHGEVSDEWKSDLGRLSVKYVDLDWVNTTQPQDMLDRKPWLSGLHLKLPLRLSCDLLVIGDIVSQAQLKVLQGYFKSASQQVPQQQHGGHNKHGEVQSLAAKKLKSIKFIRGGSVDNLRQSIKMHDSIHAQFVLLHVGDEDVFRTKNAQKTIERVKELAALVKELCPKSYVILSTLMRRSSKSENTVTNEVNKGIINFCKQTRESANYFYMLNNHFDPEYHTYEGRSLSNKGLRLYVDNILFVVDYFLVKQNSGNANGGNKQHREHREQRDQREHHNNHQQPQPQPQQPQQQH